MTIRATVAVLLAACCASAGPPASFSTGIDMVYVDVSVAGTSRQATRLEAGDFIVLEDGIPQQIAHFVDTGRPISLVLLVDVSDSMAEGIAVAKEGACELIDGLGWGDVARIVAFNERASIVQDYTSDRDVLKAAVRDMRGDGQTALHTALYVTLKDLARQERDRNRRQVVVVFSDGADTVSSLTDDQLLEQARLSEVAVYPVYLGEVGEADALRRGQARYLMEGLAQQSGGRAWFPTRADDVRSVSRRLARELHSQYSLGYVSTNPERTRSWRQILIFVRHGGLEVRHRLGYYTTPSTVSAR